MKITSVEPQKKNPKRFNIFLDGEFAFGADEDLVVDRRLIIGKEIFQDDLEVLINEAEIGKLMERLYGLLGRRQRSEKEIRDYLKQLSFKRKFKEEREISVMVIDQLMDKLKRKGLVNDQEFARAWVESRSKKKGVVALKSELFQKGIDKVIIEQVLGEKSQVLREDETAKKLLAKKLKLWKNLSEMTFKQKALRFLMSRGFEYDVVKEVVENIRKNEV